MSGDSFEGWQAGREKVDTRCQDKRTGGFVACFSSEVYLPRLPFFPALTPLLPLPPSVKAPALSLSPDVCVSTAKVCTNQIVRWMYMHTIETSISSSDRIALSIHPHLYQKIGAKGYLHIDECMYVGLGEGDAVESLLLWA